MKSKFIIHNDIIYIYIIINYENYKEYNRIYK